MSGPVELRFFAERATLDEIANGVQCVRLPVGPMIAGQQPHAMFKTPAVLQFRYKEKVRRGSEPVVEWSEWQNVGYVREGETPDDLPDKV